VLYAPADSLGWDRKQKIKRRQRKRKSGTAKRARFKEKIIKERKKKTFVAFLGSVASALCPAVPAGRVAERYGERRTPNPHLTSG